MSDLLDVEAAKAADLDAGRERRAVDWATLAGPYLGLLAVIALFSGLLWLRGGAETFLSLANLKLVAVHAAIIATVAVGMTVIMISGGIDLSVGYVVSLVTVVTVLVYRWVATVPALAATASLWAILTGIAVGALAGLANGLVITQFRIVPFVATLGTMGVARGLAQTLSRGQRVTFPGLPPDWVPWLGAIEPQQAWLLMGPAPWSVLLLAGAAAVLLRYTVLGRYCYALGSNEATARLCGIPVARTKVLLYTLAGLVTGWAGILQTARAGAGSHDIQAGLELEVIAAVVIGGGSLSGGEGTITGTLVGSLLLAILENGCSKLRLPNEFRFIIIGAIIVGVAALNSWRQRRLR
jgi:ribose transport system permease protein